MGFSGLEKITAKVFNDPVLFEVYETAREANKHETPEPLPAIEIQDRWACIQELREQRKSLFWNWPRDRPAKAVGLELRALKAEEWKLLGEIQGQRKPDLMPPLTWFTEFVFPNGTEAKCFQCEIQRHVTTEEIVKWLGGIPKCKKCGNRIVILRP